MADESNEAPEGESPVSDELDPELIKLPRPKTRIRPIMAMAIIGICLTIGVRLSGDLRFSRLGDPIQVASVDALGDAHVNQFIELKLHPDRPQALRVVPSRATTGQVLVPTLGTQGRVWVLLPATAWGATAATNEVYRGRVSRLADTNFYDALKSHVAAGTVAWRPIPLSEVHRALTEKVLQLADASGDQFVIASDIAVQIEEVAINRVRILAVATDPYRDEASWSLVLQNAGILPPETAPVTSTTTTWTFDVPAPNGLAAVNEALRTSKLFAAQATEIRSTRQGTWADLDVDGEDIVLGKARVGFRTQSVAIKAPPLVASNGFVLDTTEEPGAYWYVIIIVLALAAFALLFGAALYESIRRR